MASIDSKTEHDDDVKEKQEKIEFKMSDSVRTLRLFVPGRICLFGEHSDWAGSYRRIDPTIQKGRCIVCGTNQGIYANVQAHSSKLICISTNERGNKLTGNDYFECNMDLNELYSIAQSGNTYSYVAGVAYQILLKHRIGGLIVNNYSTTLPLKKGLSSSAAICVLIARAFNKIYGLKLTIEGEMEYAYLGERTTPSQCGRMDQCCAYGSRPVSMEFDKDNVISKELQFGSTSSSLYLVIVDLNKGKDTKTILSDLNKCYSKEKQNDNISINVRKLLGEKNLDITSRAIEAIAHGNIDIVGKLMTEAQELFRKYAAPASPIQLKSEWLYKLLSFNKISKYIYGGKGVGSQGDGACQLLCKSATDQNIVCNIIENEFKGMQCIKLTIGGYQKITKCVIPTANYGSSLFPSSKCISTALFPIIDHCDGLLKPAILILCEQVIKCDINEIYLIVSPHDLQSFESLFYSKLPLEQIEKLSPELQRYYAKILSDGRKIKFIIQKEQLGLGHAVYEARKYINSDKFLLLLGDHLYKTKDCNQLSCIQQLVNYYKKNGCNCYGLQITNQNDIQNFGTVSGKWLNTNGSNNLDKNNNAVYITEIIEKPKIEYAIKHLQMDGLKQDEFLTIFGLYILDGARLCELIGNNINHKPPIRHNGKFQLTPCLQLLRKEQETHGIIINGLRFDIGTSPEKYVDVVNNFHRNNGHSSVNDNGQKSLHENDNNNNNNNANYSNNNLLLSKIDNLLQMLK